ncbi:DNA primase [Roseobacter sp. SK209-2-6]|uniref:DNA primase n=1 Tax=Roseobacter sp. SK209-2-6 TaxID=388739 RepID=UPI0000F3EFA4|nr:DNA primase [Roseobacter sp. SK209-2-6]EBA16655.1 DNA primase [Roseobacter sp. SK209-2-6]
MSLPPGFLDELRTRISISDVVGRKVMWDQRKSQPGKGDYWSPCPFHHEKTASFHVEDRKGFYYCFGCHAKGDALKFVQETENVSFMEAVEILAGEAGMEMPKRDPRAQEKQDRRTLLAEVMEQAVQFFRLQLKTGAAGPARDYLQRRGLTPPALDRWEIGFAPDGWQNLWDALRAKNVPEDLIIAAGLAKPSNKGGKPYDTFRNRIMFPIRDARGRAIAFGGRAMDPNDNAKYLNSPETELFDKGRNLYNHGPARAASGRGSQLVVAEGYMDVIALSEGGFTSSVAPLGTAVTENQLQMMWRMSDEPIIALDGDKAGIRAAMRLVDLALPHLQAGKSLRFALMPDGQDPDDLIRSKGPAAVQAVLDQAMPMVKLLWQRETEGKVFDSPERKAALDKALRDKIRLIRDPSIRKHYGEDIKEMRWTLFRGNRPPGAGGYDGTEGKPGSYKGGNYKGGGFRDGARRPWKGQAAAQAPLSTTRSSLVAAADESELARVREAVVLAVAISCPWIIVEFEVNLERMTCADGALAALRDQVLRHGVDAPEQLKERICETLGSQALENLMSLRHVAIIPCLRRPEDLEAARLTLAEEFAKLEALRGLNAELAEAEEDLSGLADEALTWRLKEAAEARNRAVRSENEDKATYDVGENGARLSREERDAFGALLDRIGFSNK